MEEKVIKETPRDVSPRTFASHMKASKKRNAFLYYEKWFEEEDKKEQTGEKE